MNRENQYLSFRLSTWMCGQGLHLKGIELMLFGIIWTFALQGRQMFLSERSLADIYGCTREQVGRSLASLQKKHLVIRSAKRTKHGRQLSPTYDYTIDFDGIGKMFRTIRVIWNEERKLHITTRQYVSLRGDNKSHNEEGGEYIYDIGGEEGGYRQEHNNIYIPTLEEVKAYAVATNSLIDPQSFYDECKRRKWLIAGEPVKDWQKLFDSWMPRQRPCKGRNNECKMSDTHKDFVDDYTNLLSRFGYKK